MERREPARSTDRPAKKFGKGSFVLIGCCVAIAVLGIFIGVIVIYGGSQAV